MLIAIHERKGSFSDAWIKYCLDNNIPYRAVNCNSNNIVEELEGCNGLLWHWAHNDYKALNFARQLIISLEKTEIKIFPDINTGWHYDDKVGQKYLLEAVNAPLIDTYVFYEKKTALDWAKKTNYPIVFKLRGGAGSNNVKLIKSYRQSKKIIVKSFRKGYKAVTIASKIKERLWVFKRDKNIKALIKILKDILLFKQDDKLLPVQKGYVYFQKFLPNNDYDTRIYVFGDKAFSTIRYNRKGDFKASGSGLKSYDPNLIDKRVLKIAFETSDKLKLQSCAYDFVLEEGEPKIIEISYCFGKRQLTGYWNRDLEYIDELKLPEEVIIENFINTL